MIPWELLDRGPVPENGGEISLHQRGREFSIRVNDRQLMNSLTHGSEESLAELTCARLTNPDHAQVLIGGLGMGFTAAAALKHLGPQSQIVIAELVPAVVEWNRGPLAHLAGNPLRDCRVKVLVQDVAQVLRSEKKAFDAVLLDVDNGPQGLTRHSNDWLYAPPGLKAARAALRPDGVLSVWSAGPDAEFSQTLRRAGFQVEEVRVHARGKQGGGRHVIWLAQPSS